MTTPAHTNPATKVEPAQSGDWIERAEGELAAAGHKRGGARRAVLELLDAQRCALTAVEIEDALRVAKRRVSRACATSGYATTTSTTTTSSATAVAL
jgi:hypothetical protein